MDIGMARPNPATGAMDRRTLLCGAGAVLALSLAACTEKREMTDALWQQWQADWRRMEEIARRRGWDVTPVVIGPPAREGQVRMLEQRHGLKVPPQLREVLTRYSSRVGFGWYIPIHLQPLERENLPTMSANRMALWDLDHITNSAIPNFLNWKRDLASVDLSEAPNRPEMWEHQFPFYDLVNGDMLTIDMSKPEGPHPVRYFSHELEMLHGLALAPDFLTFVTQMSKIGFAGTEWASFMPFGTLDEAAGTYYLRADGAGAKRWLAYLEKDPAKVDPDEPPPAIVAKTPAEEALLTAARAGSIEGVRLALKAGARPDVVPDPAWMMETVGWDQEFATALTYAVRANNIPLAEVLLEGGATLDTRRLLLGDAVQVSSLETIRWLVAKGVRVNGWKQDRHWPLHLLVTRRSEVSAPSRAALEARLRAESRRARGSRDDELPEMKAWEEQHLRERLALWLDRATYLAMLDTLLKAGATPDARWDNGITMLMWADADDGEVLIKAGADVNARDIHGSTALHRARTAAKIRMLVAHGADIDALEQPAAEEDGGYNSTPLQTALLLARLGGLELVETLLELGADPKKRDSAGRSALCYCTLADTFRLMIARGLDPHERIPGGGTLLHNLLRITSVRASWPEEVASLDFLLGLGLPINGVDNDGRTLLHVAAEQVQTPADISLLLERGADKTVRDKTGKRPVDLVPKSLKDIRALLA